MPPMYSQFRYCYTPETPYECSTPGRSLTIEYDRGFANLKQTVQKYHCAVPECRYSSGQPKFFSRKDNWRRHMLRHQSEDGV